LLAINLEICLEGNLTCQHERQPAGNLPSLPVTKTESLTSFKLNFLLA
jgi:hypothetical protein